MKNKTFILILIVLAISVVISFSSYLPNKIEGSTDVKMSDFPNVVGEWVSQGDIGMDERVYELLETRNVIMRDYKNKEGKVINLTIVYSKDNRKVSHPPEICLQGEGSTITKKSFYQLTKDIKANFIVLESPNYKQLAVYWYRAGSVSTEDYLKQQLIISFNKLLGKRVSGSLVRLMTSDRNLDSNKSLKTISDFSNLIEPLLVNHVP